MAKKAGMVGVEDVLAAIETARDKVMSDEVKGLVKLGLPRGVAAKMVEDRYRQKQDGDEHETDQGIAWGDMS